VLVVELLRGVVAPVLGLLLALVVNCQMLLVEQFVDFLPAFFLVPNGKCGQEAEVLIPLCVVEL
jgi:hypothetical protein